MKLQSVHATHVGLVRANNEDAFLDNLAWRLFAVADGIGGHAGGEEASRIAVEALRDTGVSGNSLEDGVRLAHARILGAMRVNSDLAGMGATLTVARVDRRIIVANAGDSVAYLTRGRRTKQLTTEQHSGNALDNCVGVTESALREVEIAEEAAEAGDVLVLCTDGLSRYLGAQQIGRIAEAAPFEKLADDLVHCALAAGGEDNITVVAVKILEVS